MAYDKAILKRDALKVIDELGLLTIEDVACYLGLSKSTIYSYFPNDSNDLNELKDLIQKNKINTKAKIRKKWLERDSDTGLIALYKLCATPEEHEKLTQTRQSHIVGGDPENPLITKIVREFVHPKN